MFNRDYSMQFDIILYWIKINLFSDPEWMQAGHLYEGDKQTWRRMSNMLAGRVLHYW